MKTLTTGRKFSSLSLLSRIVFFRWLHLFTLSFFFLFPFLFLTESPALTHSEKNRAILIAVFDLNSKQEFQTKMEPQIRSYLSACSFCDIKNFSPYDEAGNFDAKKLAFQVQIAAEQTNLLFFSSNIRLTDDYKDVVETFKSVIAKGALIVGPSGTHKSTENGAPLSRTLLGKVSDIIIIGELTEKERLLPDSYFGPEMLTAIKPDKEKSRQNITPLIFLSELLRNWNKRNASEWSNYLKNKKALSRRFWPGLDEFFQK